MVVAVLKCLTHRIIDCYIQSARKYLCVAITDSLVLKKQTFQKQKYSMHWSKQWS